MQDRFTRFLLASPRLEQIFGWVPDEIPTWLCFISADDSVQCHSSSKCHCLPRQDHWNLGILICRTTRKFLKLMFNQFNIWKHNSHKGCKEVPDLFDGINRKKYLAINPHRIYGIIVVSSSVLGSLPPIFYPPSLISIKALEGCQLPHSLCTSPKSVETSNRPKAKILNPELQRLFQAMMLKHYRAKPPSHSIVFKGHFTVGF